MGQNVLRTDEARASELRDGRLTEIGRAQDALKMHRDSEADDAP